MRGTRAPWPGAARLVTCCAVLLVFAALTPWGTSPASSSIPGSASGSRSASGPVLGSGSGSASGSGPASAYSSTHYAWYRLGDLFPRYGGPLDPGPPPRGLSSVAPADCATCHAEIAAEWQGSAHARAFLNPVFLGEYLPSPERFCERCHAPLLRRPSAADKGARLARGVDCAVCHVRGGHVLGVRGTGDADHAARRDTRLRTSAFCGSCHQFDFPEPQDDHAPRYHPGRPLQNTLVEWRQSAFARQSCQSCHMPQAGGEPGARRHASHAFSTFDNAELLAGAVKVGGKVRRRGAALEVTLELSAGELGHAFPTGDMFRQGELTVRLGEVAQRVTLQRIFAQTITADASGHRLGQVDDTRLVPGARWRQRFRFESAGGEQAVRWTLTLLRLDPATARRRGLPMSLVRVPMAAGELAVPAR